MKEHNFTTSFSLKVSPQEAFKSINNVTKWWTENLEGSSSNLHDEFTVQFGDVHFSKQKLVEVIPDKKIVWLVTDSKLNFTQDKHEWTGTRIIFEIVEKNNETQITFTHIGLVPAFECYSACSNAWSQYIQESLQSLIATGKGQPTRKEGNTKVTTKI